MRHRAITARRTRTRNPPPPAAARRGPPAGAGPSGFQLFVHWTGGGDAGGEQGSAEAATGVERGGVTAVAQPAALPVIAAHAAAESAERCFELEDVGAAPPQHVTLQVERLARIDAGMDEEQTAVHAEGGALEVGEQLTGAGPRIDRGAQARGPARQRQRAVARRCEALAQLGTVGRERGADAVSQHPFQHFARVGRELQLEELLPDLFLPAAQEGDVARKSVAPREKQAAERHQLVNRAGDVGPVAELAAAIDEACALLPTPRQPAV